MMVRRASTGLHRKQTFGSSLIPRILVSCVCVIVLAAALGLVAALDKLPALPFTPEGVTRNSFACGDAKPPQDFDVVAKQTKPLATVIVYSALCPSESGGAPNSYMLGYAELARQGMGWRIWSEARGTDVHSSSEPRVLAYGTGAGTFHGIAYGIVLSPEARWVEATFTGGEKNRTERQASGGFVVTASGPSEVCEIRALASEGTVLKRYDLKNDVLKHDHRGRAVCP